MSFTFGAQVGVAAATATISASLPAVPVGAVIVVLVQWNPGGGVTLSGVNDGVAYSQAGSTIVTGSSDNGAVYLLTGATAGTHNITATFSAAISATIDVFWVGGASVSDGCTGADSPFAGTGADAVVGGSVTTTVAGDCIIGLFAPASGGGVVSAGTSYTSLGFATTGNFGEQLTQGAAGAITATGTSSISSDIIAFTLALKPVFVSTYTLSANFGIYAVTGEPAILTQAAATSYLLLANAGNYATQGLQVFSDLQLEVAAGHYTTTVKALLSQALGGMPNMIGMLLRGAEQSLQDAGILVPLSIGYFGKWPITVLWVQSTTPPGTVVGQIPAPNAPMPAPNGLVTLLVSEMPMNVAYPGTNLMSS